MAFICFRLGGLRLVLGFLLSLAAGYACFQQLEMLPRPDNLPLNLAARTGLANSYYALADLKNSEHVFKDTIRLHPRAGSAYNNLAQVLMEKGRCPEAWEMTRKAVILGGPLQAVYRQTLKDIEIEWINKREHP